MRASQEVRKWYSKIGKKGGQSRSKAKVAAVRKNGLKGGRPPKNRAKRRIKQ